MSVSMIPTRHALVVGGTSGIGHGIALALAKRDYQVTIAGRSEVRGNEIVAQLCDMVPTQKRQHAFCAVDGFNLQSVKELAERFQQQSVDVLVLTQGMATLQGYTPTTADGLDQKLQLHYFSRIYMACLLAPRMKEGSRILSVLAAGVHDKYKFYEEDFELKKHYSVKNAADAATFYMDAGFETLSDQYPQLVMAHATPGFVNTNWGSEMPWMVRAVMIRPMQRLFATSLEECGETLTTALLHAPAGYNLIGSNGEFLDKAKNVKHTKDERQIIWEKTLEVLPDF